MNAKEFDKYLPENCVKPEYVAMNPKLWNGYWYIKSGNAPIRKMFRFIGKLLRNKRVYWLGLPIRWETGVKEIMPEAKFYDIYS